MSTPWQYTDCSHRFVFYADDVGAMHSASVTALEVQAWITEGNTPAAEPGLAPEQAAAAAFAAGIVLASTGTPALNGTYKIDSDARSLITSEQIYIATTGKFTNGKTSRAWKDAAGALHAFPDVAHFTAFAEAVAQLVDAIYAAQEAAAAGGAWVAPDNVVTIA